VKAYTSGRETHKWNLQPVSESRWGRQPANTSLAVAAPAFPELLIEGRDKIHLLPVLARRCVSRRQRPLQIHPGELPWSLVPVRSACGDQTIGCHRYLQASGNARGRFLLDGGVQIPLLDVRAFVYNNAGCFE
jgi:hypothetical protein